MIKGVTLSLLTLIITGTSSSFQKSHSIYGSDNIIFLQKGAENQMVNLFVSHGHCITPFAGKVTGLEILARPTKDDGNPLEEMKMFFEIDPKTFTVYAGEEFTSTIKTPGLFIGENDERLTFRSTTIYTLGVDWYHVKGTFSIRGIEREVSLYVSGIRNSNGKSPEFLVIEGRFNLMDWGIDYDKIVNNHFSANPDRWMHLNMKVKMG